MVLSALAPPLILIWVLPRNWESAAILAVTVPLIPLFMVLVGMAAEQRIRRRWRTLSTLGARFPRSLLVTPLPASKPPRPGARPRRVPTRRAPGRVVASADTVMRPGSRADFRK